MVSKQNKKAEEGEKKEVGWSLVSVVFFKGHCCARNVSTTEKASTTIFFVCLPVCWWAATQPLWVWRWFYRTDLSPDWCVWPRCTAAAANGSRPWWQPWPEHAWDILFKNKPWTIGKNKAVAQCSESLRSLFLLWTSHLELTPALALI